MVLRPAVTTIRAHLADRATRLIACAGASLLLCMTALGAYLCADLRTNAWQDARRNAANLLSVMEEGVGHSIRNYDLSLREAAHLASRPDIAALEPGLQRLALFDVAATGSGLGLLAVTDFAGRVVMTSDPGQGNRPDLSDLPEFETLRGNPLTGLILTGPTRSRMTGQPIIRMTHRIATSDGTFKGIATGSILLDHFQALLDRLRFDDSLAITVFHRDGTLLLRSPAPAAALGRTIAPDARDQHNRMAKRGEFLGRSPVDGAARLYLFSNLDGLPMTVSVGTSLDSIREAWIYKAAIIGILILCLNILTFSLTILLHREVGRRAAAEADTRQTNAALAILARTDGLTGLPNRRCYDECVAAEWKRATLHRTPLALMIVDADHFKQFNDRFGHQRGDDVLRAMAGCLRRTQPSGGLGFRIGGEEFVVLLPGLDAEAASAAAERLRRAIVNLQIGHAPEVGDVATVSIGVASAEPDAGETPDTLFMAADAALYAAKKAGRNRVRAAPRSVPLPIEQCA
ncbi:GGDEF domain-containing protein [Methylobacterium mesophilicum SR1.6/6]|uniref:diguanylate cyclase n=2 Tax=Methylobacterium mesophilicum TaxID=39956 RepID=A0A6B9FQ25_9HYPH|nr:GGDEF domain-containing protein [Methylobacterium mesophilicum SR1.6/6]